MIEGKEKYNSISIPGELSNILEKTYVRHNKQNKTLKLKYSAAVAAACFMLFIASNVQMTYAALSEIPLVGELVRVLHIGKGGAVTDGAIVNNQAEEDVLKLRFDQPDGQMGQVPY